MIEGAPRHQSAIGKTAQLMALALEKHARDHQPLANLLSFDLGHRAGTRGETR
ncbi:hypothetical protein [Methylobacterium sp. CM6244]